MESEAWATQEVQRYTFLMPGQAPSYFGGYRALVTLRQEVEKRQGAAFSARRFHDTVLAQGCSGPTIEINGRFPFRGAAVLLRLFLPKR